MEQTNERKITQNIHTHTMRCKHAVGDVADYVQAALEQGLTTLGFSDHTPLPDNWALPIRMEEKELPGYIAAIRAAQAEQKELAIYAGLECDYFPRYESYFRDELLGGGQLDYLVGSIHAVEINGTDYHMYANSSMDNLTLLQEYAKVMVKAIESGLFAFIAHPDLINGTIQRWNPDMRGCMREILAAAASCNVPLEINTSGYEKARQNPELFLPAPYPMEQFWEEAANFPVSVVVNSDAHAPALLTADMQAGYKIMEKYGLKEAVLPFLHKA